MGSSDENDVEKREKNDNPSTTGISSFEKVTMLTMRNSDITISTTAVIWKLRCGLEDSSFLLFFFANGFRNNMRGKYEGMGGNSNGYGEN